MFGDEETVKYNLLQMKKTKLKKGTLCPLPLWPEKWAATSEEKNLTPEKLQSLHVSPGFGPKMTDRHPPLLQRMWLNWSNCSLDSVHRFPLNIWNVSRSSFISSFLHCAGAPLNYGNTKGQAFQTVCAPAGALGDKGGEWGWAHGSACPLLLRDCVSAVWSDVTLRRHYPHHCASLPLCTGNQLWQPWPCNLIGPVISLTPSHRDGAQIHHYYMQTSGLLY